MYIVQYGICIYMIVMMIHMMCNNVQYMYIYIYIHREYDMIDTTSYDTCTDRLV